jgi:cell division protease FtsH
MKPLSKNIILFILSILVIAAIFSTYNLSGEKPEEVSISTLVEEIKTGQVKSIAVTGSDIKVTLQDDKKQESRKESAEPLSDLLTNYGVTSEQLQAIDIAVEDQSRQAYFLGVILPSLLPLAILVIIFWFMIRQLQGANSRAMSFGQSSAREFSSKSKDRLTFKDVAGEAEAKEELMEEVEFLKNPKKFVELGAKIPKGVLLMGPPGTGKTLLARAVAGEANVPFFHISGSEFVEMFVGVGAARVRDLFSKAKKSAPCIIFIDEIDAVGRQRGAGLGGSHDEREQTLNQILVEMDGFDPNIGVIVIAATNRPDVLDPALLRPGRFDRRVVLDLPDIKDREAILTIHAKNKPLEKDVNIRRVAERTPGFSGADLSNLLNEAAIRAARHDRKSITQEDVLDSIEKVLLGPERKSHILSPKEREVTAYHEGGHALVAKMLPNADPVHKVSIISRGRAAGYTLKLPTEDKKMHRRAEFIDDLAVMLGGYVAEKEVFGDITTGASDDLRKATRLARALVTRYGMSDALGPRTFGEQEEMIFLGREIHESRDYSEKLAEKIDEEINKLVHGAMETARDILKKEREHLDRIAKILLEKETIERDEFEAIFKPV